jgi:hypothetical protein
MPAELVRLSAVTLAFRETKMLGKIVLLLSGLMFLVFGIGFLIAPTWLGGKAGLIPDGPLGRVELRAFYGGMEVGLGLFLLGAAAARKQVRAMGLVAAAMLLGATALGRLVGFAVEGGMPGWTWLYVLIEAALAAGAAHEASRQK